VESARKDFVDTGVDKHLILINLKYWTSQKQLNCSSMLPFSR